MFNFDLSRLPTLCEGCAGLFYLDGLTDIEGIALSHSCGSNRQPNLVIKTNVVTFVPRIAIFLSISK